MSQSQPAPQQPRYDHEFWDLTPVDVRQFIEDPQAAEIAYILLFIKRVEGEIDVYQPAGHTVSGRRFNVWDNKRWERVTLAEWCQRWYAAYQRGEDPTKPQEGSAQ